MTKAQTIFKTPRNRSRGFALQGVYQYLVAGHDLGAIQESMSEVGGFDQCDKPLFHELLSGVIQHRIILDQLLIPHLDRPLNRLSFIEYAILLLATFELKECLSVPMPVVLNEAINLSKIFGGEDSFKYINQVLERLAAQLRPSEMTSSNSSPPNKT